MSDPDLRWIADATGAGGVRRGERIQSLWGGYGELFRVQLTGAAVETAIVKRAQPPARLRGAKENASHARKCRSYDVETAWYRSFAARCDDACRVPSLLGSRASKDQWLLVLEDLDAAGFGARRRDPDPAELDLCLSWLAAFHARFLGAAPNGLWKTGTYWHLATRRDELAAIDDAELRDAAPILDERLRRAVFQTLVHGDAKVANFCFTPRARAVAAVDFQYVGGGCGMKDVAYFLSSCASYGDEALERRHLNAYFGHLREALARDPSGAAAVDVEALETEWRGLYPVACADFYRFLAGWSKEHWRRDVHGQRITRNVLRALG
jgi:hypothetical protein